MLEVLILVVIDFLGTRKINWKEIILESTLSQLKCAEKELQGGVFLFPSICFF